MGSLNRFNTAAGAFGAVQTMNGVKEQGQLLERLLWEQQVTNRLLWAGLTDEQKAAVEWPPPLSQK